MRERIGGCLLLAVVPLAVTPPAGATAAPQGEGAPLDATGAEPVEAHSELGLQAMESREQLFLWGDKLRPHRKNYILAGSWDRSLSDRPSPVAGGENEDVEVKFQASFRYPIWPWRESGDDRLSFAYTALSYWQLYDFDSSSPFRTTDHEPELFWEHDFPRELQSRVGVVHQSNGESGTADRSWNRVYGELLYRFDPRVRGDWKSWGVGLKAWYVFSEAQENEDILDYVGPFELRGEYWFAGKRRPHLAAAWRNNLWLNDDNRGSLQVDFAVQLVEGLRLLVQYYNGYGESLLDYDRSANRLSLGLEFSS